MPDRLVFAGSTIGVNIWIIALGVVLLEVRHPASRAHDTGAPDERELRASASLRVL